MNHDMTGSQLKELLDQDMDANVNLNEPNDESVQLTGHGSPESIPVPKAALLCTEMNSFGIYCK